MYGIFTLPFRCGSVLVLAPCVAGIESDENPERASIQTNFGPNCGYERKNGLGSNLSPVRDACYDTIEVRYRLLAEHSLVTIGAP